MSEISGNVADNAVCIIGCMLQRDALRLTPARIPVVGFCIEHKSRQVEADVEREVSCQLEVRAIGPIAHQICAVPPGSKLVLEGFLANKSARSRAPVLHVRKFELLEGMNNGF
ncbi:MAG TPA: primosomal replication protein N [Rhodocyclaceae bacterium]|nr:primosomal replication protein N [Rhodocyclaceae bacterium]